MNTGELACGVLDEMDRLMNEEEKITGFEICQKLTGEERDQEFTNLLGELIALNIVERYDFVGRNGIGYYIQLSNIGKNTVRKIEDVEMRKYFIVAIIIYCNQKKFTPNELGELLSKTDSFENKDEIERIIENFRKIFGIEESFVKINGDWKRAMKIKDCAFCIFSKEE
jgi:hypothetical protein